MFWRHPFFSFALITLLMGAIGVIGNGIPEQQIEQGQWVTHTHEVLNQLVTLSGELAEVSAAHGDFLQTQAADDRDLYKRTTTDIQRTLATIDTLTKDNPVQQSHIPTLRQSIESQIDHFSQAINSLPAAMPQPDPNKSNIATIGGVIDTMRQEEERLLAARVKRWHTAMMETRLLILGGIAALYGCLLAAYMIMRKEARTRERLLAIETETAAVQRGMAARMMEVLEIQLDITSQRLNLQNAMTVITERTQQITHADGAVIEMLEIDHMSYRAASGSMAPFIGFKLKAAGSLTGLCIETGMTLRCDDSETDKRVDKEACRKVGLRSMIVVPLVQNEQTVGVLKVASARPHAFTAEEVGTLQLMAGMLSATLQDAVVVDALQDTNMSLILNNELLRTEKIQLESDKSELKVQADNDGMTGLKNHRYFQECLALEYTRAQRYNNALSLIMVDVDHFKQFNDRFGHPAGDEVLKQMGALLRSCSRPSDCVARYGGEEFAIILTQTSLEGAVKTAERIREMIRNAEWEHQAITASIGISGLENGASEPSVLIAQADKALYQSKTHGRNRVTPFAA